MRRHHELPATKRTVLRGVVSQSDAPALTIDSGDTVSIETWTAWGNRITPATTMEDVLRMSAEAGDAGPHDLTGPIAVRGAVPGDVIRVDVLDIRLRPHVYNFNLPGHLGRGVLAEDVADAAISHYRLTGSGTDSRLEFAPGIEVPVRPFLGYMGVAPPAEGPHRSSPPGAHGGNIDVPDLTVGSSLFLPVWAEGGLFCAGDAHAAQGYGEVNITALEASAEAAVLRFTLLRGGPPLGHPRAETPSDYLSLAFDPSLVTACTLATRDIVGELCRIRPDLARHDAYALCSMGLNLKISQLVNGPMGIHACLPKELFPKGLPWFDEPAGWRTVSG